MASTRNKNTPGNYCLEQRDYRQAMNWELYPNAASGVAYNTGIPGNGLLPGQIRSTQLSHNSINIESFLFGINVTDLTKSEFQCITPEIKQLDMVNIFSSDPTYIPEKLIVSKNNRPFNY